MTQLQQYAADPLARTPGQVRADGAVDRLCELLLERMTRDGYADDVTLLGAQLSAATPAPFRCELPAPPQALAVLRRDLNGWLAALGADPDDLMNLQLGIGEAATNASDHAGAGWFTVEAHLDATGRVCVTVSDDGTWREPPDEAGYRGRGLALLRHVADNVELDTTGPGTAVYLDKELHRSPGLASSGGAVPRPDRDRDVPFALHTTGADPLCVTVVGVLDLATTAQLRSHLASASRGGAVPIILGLTLIAQLASAGVLLLPRARRAVRGGRAPAARDRPARRPGEVRARPHRPRPPHRSVARPPPQLIVAVASEGRGS